MSAKAFNENWQKGQTAAGKRLPALQRKYEAVLRANAKKTAERYSTVTAAARPDRSPSDLIDESGLKVAITARTLAERRRMAKMVATPLVADAKPVLYEDTLHTLGNVQAEAATKAVRDALAKVISDSLDQGWTVPETADQIQTTLTDYATWEATRLARSDLVGISNGVSLRAASSLGDQAPKFKRWLTAGDDLVREEHQIADGQTVEIGSTFDVGGFPMDHPGDPLAPYELWLNCRCVPIYLDTADAKASHSFEGGIVEDPIAVASDKTQEALAAASEPDGSLDEMDDPTDPLEADPDEVVLEIIDQAAAAILAGESGQALSILIDAVNILQPDPSLVAATFTEKQRTTLAKEGVALPDGSFPIRNRADLSNAIASLGRAKDSAAAKKHIIARARDLGALNELPDAWGITAAGLSLYTDEVDPWYAKPDTAPVSRLIAEHEQLFKGNQAVNRRFGVQIPNVYDSTVAAREAGLRGLNASGTEEIPLEPPDEWFEDPGFDAPTPLTVTADGRVMGHLGEWGKCHTGIGGRCVMIPRSQTGYADFHTGGLVTASGKEIRVGRLTLDTGHAPLQAGASRAAAHYDHTGHVGAFVRAGEDQFGPWLAGSVRSDATPEQIRDLRANPPSGDWRKLYGRNGLELIAALAVPVQGFPVAALAASGEVTGFISGWGDTGELALVASGEPDEMEREWDLLVARLDGIEGLAALVASNENHDASGKFDFGSGSPAERARAAKAMRNTNEMDDPPVMRDEVGRVEAPSQFGDHGFKAGEQVRTAEGHLGTVKGGDSYSGSQVPVERASDGMVEHHDPETLRREGPRAALPPRDRGNVMVASTITIQVDDDGPLDISDGRIDTELGLQVGYFRDHGYWSPDQLSGSTLTPEQMTMVKTLAPMMIENPDSETSTALLSRLDAKGLLV